MDGQPAGAASSAHASAATPRSAPFWRNIRVAAINESGVAAGDAETASGVRCALLWKSGVAQAITVPAGRDRSAAVAINDSGHVAGWSSIANATSPEDRTFAWNGTVVRELPAAPGEFNTPAAISNSGQVAGTSFDANGGTRAILWTGGGITNLGAFPDPSFSRALASDMNDRGVIVGSAVPPHETADGLRILGSAAFIWQNGAMRSLLPDTGIAESGAQGINEAGDVVGYLVRRGSERRQAFLWQAGKVSDLPSLPGWVRSEASAINDHGQVVGSAEDRQGRVHAVLWEQDGVRDLGILPGTRWSVAVAINNRGQVVGYGEGAGERSRAFIWESGSMRELTLPAGPLAGCGSAPDEAAR